MRFQKLKLSNANPPQSHIAEKNTVPPLSLLDGAEEGQDDKGKLLVCPEGISGVKVWGWTQNQQANLTKTHSVSKCL
jgi:hypothetical protein